MMFVWMPPCKPTVMIVSVTYHPTSFCVSTKHWYFCFFFVGQSLVGP